MKIDMYLFEYLKKDIEFENIYVKEKQNKYLTFNVWQTYYSIVFS